MPISTGLFAALCIALAGALWRALEANRALRERHSGFATTLVQHHPLGIALINPGRRILLANPAFATLFESSPASLVGKPLKRCFPVNDLPTGALSVDYASKKSSVYEIRFLGSDSQEKQLRIYVSRLADKKGKRGAILLVVQDATDMIQAQIAVIRELAFLSSVANMGRVTHVRGAWREAVCDACEAVVAHCGFADSALIFRTPETISMSERHATFRTSRNRMPNIRSLISRDGPVPAIRTSDETTLKIDIMKDHPTWRIAQQMGFTQLVSRKIKVGGKTAAILMGFLTHQENPDEEDMARFEHLAVLITSALNTAVLFETVRQKNIVLEDTVTQLKGAQEARAQFVRFLVHDLNKPLAAIIGTAGRLSKNDALPERSRGAATRIEKAASRLRSIVKNLLDHERIGSGRQELLLEQFDMTALLIELVGAIQEHYAHREIILNGQPFHAHLDVVSVMIHGDRVLVGRILQNLIDNAVTHGENRVEMTVGELTSNAEVVIWNDTRDNDSVVELFQEFQRGTAASNREGYGLGLSAIQTMAQAHGGRIDWAHPERGGIEFRFTVPLDSPHTTKAASAS